MKVYKFKQASQLRSPPSSGTQYWLALPTPWPPSMPASSSSALLGCLLRSHIFNSNITNQTNWIMHPWSESQYWWSKQGWENNFMCYFWCLAHWLVPKQIGPILTDSVWLQNLRIFVWIESKKRLSEYLWHKDFAKQVILTQYYIIIMASLLLGSLISCCANWAPFD